MAQAEFFHTHSGAFREPAVLSLRGRGPSLADDPVFLNAALSDDPDCECGSWPNFVDQRMIGEPMTGRFWHEDDELDDAA